MLRERVCLLTQGFLQKGLHPSLWILKHCLGLHCSNIRAFPTPVSECVAWGRASLSDLWELVTEKMLQAVWAVHGDRPPVPAQGQCCGFCSLVTNGNMLKCLFYYKYVQLYHPKIAVLQTWWSSVAKAQIAEKEKTHRHAWWSRPMILNTPDPQGEGLKVPG